MIGAVVGDIVGSRFEWDNYRAKDFEFFTNKCFPTDDSVMTLALAEAILVSKPDYSDLSKNAVECMQRIGRNYPDCGYGGAFGRWMFSDDPKPYNSYGNGAAMRVSAAGFAASSLEEAKQMSGMITEVTHNHPEGMKGAEATVTAIYMARTGSSIPEIRDVIDQNYYPMNFTLDGIRDTYQFNETCQNTVPQALMAFFESTGFEDAIRNAISIGGDSDTVAAITGGVAEAYYGVPEDIRKQALTFLDERLLRIVEAFEERYPAGVGNVEKAKTMSINDLRAEYRIFLQQQGLSKNSIMTSSNDAFYLWKNVSKEVFWEKILADDFEKEYRAAMLDALAANSKGNPDALVSNYISHARKFKSFLEQRETSYQASVKMVKKTKTDVEVPQPTADEVEAYLRQWDDLENYHLQEDALDKLFLDLCPNNTDISDILIKVATLNDFYSTNIFSVYPVAKHILLLDIDARMKAGDVTLVGDIQKVIINGAEKNFYSFATKYCSHHNPLEYPIYDSYVEKVLKYFRDKNGFAAFSNDDLKDYIHFKGALVDFRKFYGLENYNLKQIDKYIWQLGKKYFPKNYGKSK